MQLIRVSYGTAVKLGLIKGALKAEPTTAYLLLNHDRRCQANCGFCPQARDSTASLEYLSRVSWPAFTLEDVLKALKRTRIARICIQLVNREDVLEESCGFIERLSEYGINSAISISSPLGREQYYRIWKDKGADMIGISFDAANGRVFNEVKGLAAGNPYTWKSCWKSLEKALEVFGKGHVVVHLIVGLGESEQDMCFTMQKIVDLGAIPSLFAFTPVRGTRLQDRRSPSLDSYRRIQIARYLIVSKLINAKDLVFDNNGRMAGISVENWQKLLTCEDVFTTRGCPGCNRPFYNESPRGPIYNYPYSLSPEEFAKALLESRLVR